MPPAGCKDESGPATVRTSQQACSGQYLPTELAVSGASRPTTRTAAPRLRSTSVSAASPSTVSKVHGTRRCRCKARRATPNIATSISVRSSALRPAGNTWTKRTRDPRCTASRTAAPATRVAMPSLTRPANTSGADFGGCVPARPGVVDVCMTLIVAPLGQKRQSRKSLHNIDPRLNRAGLSSLCGLTPGGHSWQYPRLALLMSGTAYSHRPGERGRRHGCHTDVSWCRRHCHRQQVPARAPRAQNNGGLRPLPGGTDLASPELAGAAGEGELDLRCHPHPCSPGPLRPPAALVREGFTGPTWCTQGTSALAAIVLRDSAYLQEEDAENARLWGFSRHEPPLPLYNAADAEKAIASFKPTDYHRGYDLRSGAHLSFSRAGHILGAASALVTIGGSTVLILSLIHISEPTRRTPISYAVFC